MKRSVVPIFLFFILASPLVMLSVGTIAYLIILAPLSVWVGLLALKNYYRGWELFIPGVAVTLMVVFAVIKDPKHVGAVFNSVVSFVSFFAAYWMSRQDKVAMIRASLFSLFIFYSFFLLSSYRYGYSPSDVNEYFVGASRNYVSATALFFQVMYSVSYYRLHRTLPAITPWLTLVVAFFSYGRSGLALSAFLLAITLFYNFWRGGGAYRSLVLSALIFLMLFLVQNFSFLEDLILTKTNFKAGLDSPRLDMVEGYIQSLSLKSFLVGQDLSLVPVIQQYDGNPHNSLIYGHSLYGVLYFITVGWVFIAMSWALFRSRGTAIYAIMLIALLVRLSLDKISMPGVFDYIIYFIFFASIFDGNNHAGRERSILLS